MSPYARKKRHAPKFPCEICTIEKSRQRFPRAKHVPPSCYPHVKGFCLLCISKYFTTKFDIQPLMHISEIACPVRSCGIMWPRAGIKYHVPNKVFHEYEIREVEAAFEAEPTFRRCPACTSGGDFSICENEPILTCKECGQKFCFLHHLSCAAESGACSQCIGLAPGELETLEALKEKAAEGKVKPCPKCGESIEKRGGCDHMRCTRCGQVFCWRCMKVSSKHHPYGACTRHR